MRKALFTILFLGAMSSPLFGLLSPINQSVKEIDAILWSKEITQHFNQADSIQEIRKVDNGYVIATEDRQMMVEVIYIPTQRVGPQEFKLVFHPSQPN